MQLRATADPRTDFAAGPLSAEAFAGLMARCGPFGPAPRLAVAVSGGPDSVALTLLAAHWAWERGGQVLALTVDHALRPESAAEAAQVRAWLAARGVAQETLRWEGEKPSHGLQAAARAARYALLEDACRRHGLLHLLLAHHRDDQAETVEIRAQAGSGARGRAAMPAVTDRPWVQLIRPLLTVPKACLLLTCQALGHPWLEDPTNRSPRFARGRLRQEGGWASNSALEEAAAAGRARHAQDQALSALLAAHAVLHPEGWAALPSATGWLSDLPGDLARDLIARLLMAVGGSPYPPRGDRLDRLLHDLTHGPAALTRTLGGCVLQRRPDGPLRIVREARAIQSPQALLPGQDLLWDGRFRLQWFSDAPPLRPGALLTVGALGGEAARWPGLGAIPPTIRRTLPALRLDGRLLGLPLGLGEAAAAAPTVPLRTWFQPPEPLGGPPFSVAGLP